MHQQDTIVEMKIMQVAVEQEMQEEGGLDYWLGKLVAVRNIVGENILRRFLMSGGMGSVMT